MCETEDTNTSPRPFEDVDVFQDQCIEMCISLVDENEATPQDMFFVLRLLGYYYEATEVEHRSEQTVDLAWELAQMVLDANESNDELGWISYQTIIQNLFKIKLTDWVTYPDFEREKTQKPISEVIEADESNEIGKILSKITALEDTYVLKDVVGEVAIDEEKEVTRMGNLSSFYSTLECRFASQFPYDTAECYETSEFIDWYHKRLEGDTYHEREMYDALRMVKEWVMLRAKREHKMLRVGETNS